VDIQDKIEQWLDRNVPRWTKEQFKELVSLFRSCESRTKIRISGPIVKEETLADILLNLADCFQKAGGAIPSLEVLKDQTAWEFIRIIAPNEIRFHVKEKDQEDNQ